MYNNPYMTQYRPMEQLQQPNYMQQPMPQYPNTATQFVNTGTQIGTQRTGLQGKMVDSIDVVKSTDIPLDGSLSIFPLTDNSAIVTKRLKTDGTTEILTYKPVLEEAKQETKPNYIEKNDLRAILDEFNQETIETITDEIKGLKDEIKALKVKEKK